MRIPEKKHKHNKYSIDTNPPQIKCLPDCPACIEDETYKRLAQWILEQSDGLTFTVNVKADTPQIYKVVKLSCADFEALKKLAEG